MEVASETVEKVESSRSMEHSPSKSSLDSASEASDQPDRTDPSNASPNPLKDVDFLQEEFISNSPLLLKYAQLANNALKIIFSKWVGEEWGQLRFLIYVTFCFETAYGLKFHRVGTRGPLGVSFMTNLDWNCVADRFE
uniref:Uncharacterized protein n=1 Tax=Vitis vinifera TaxID=29760 RepID=A5BUV4_VITVI|nr:hypothetical protein VITISV_044289 [Vitis vinifera]